MTFCTFFKLKRKSYMLFKSRLMNPHNNNSSSHGYLSDRNMWVCRGTQFSQNPRFPCLYFPCRQSVLSPLQTHPALQRAATAAKHQLRDGAARACWDGRRQRDTECKDPVPQPASTAANASGNQRYFSLFTQIRSWSCRKAACTSTWAEPVTI